ncbi:MAG: cobaltochelatase subunit CobN [Planctomycetota bacterium]|nr:MAG: cobaltochelatase subunit CobN [Planctomycetota bacterium]
MDCRRLPPHPRHAPRQGSRLPLRPAGQVLGTAARRRLRARLHGLQHPWRLQRHRSRPRHSRGEQRDQQEVPREGLAARRSGHQRHPRARGAILTVKPRATRTRRPARVRRLAAVAPVLLAATLLLSPRSAAAREPSPAADAPTAIAFLGAWDRALPLIERAARELELEVRFPDTKTLLTEHGLDNVAVLYVLNLDPREARQLAQHLERTRAAHPRLHVIALDRRDSQAALRRRGLLEADPRVAPYWRTGGLVNIRRLLRYTAIRYLGAPGEIEPPALLPESGIYVPGLETPLTLEQLRARPNWREHPDAPVVALLIQHSFWVNQDTAVIDAEVHALERRGLRVAVVFSETAAQAETLLRALEPQLIIEDRHGSIWDGSDGTSLLERLDVPYLRPISLLAYTVEQWRTDPKGMAPRDRSLFLTIQEMRGTIEPIVVGALQHDIHGFKLHVPISDRIERFADRAVSWLRLQRKPNAEKRVAIVYYNKSLGKGDLLRGSPTGAFLDGPRSLMRFLPRLREAGYRVDPLPRDVAQLLTWARERGRNVGPWAPGELETLADQPDVVLIPASRYRRWFETILSPQQQRRVVERFGPPPGRLMVVRRNGEAQIVLPRIDCGNVILLPQPERGESQDASLLHSRDVPPPHNYLAFYWWLQHDWKADAVLHWGTHGTLELLPGKEAGLSKDDWSDVCAGNMPMIHPWIMDNIGEATLSRRRAYAVLVDHLPPPSVGVGLSDALRRLHDTIDQFHALEPGLLRSAFRKQITQQARKQGLLRTLQIEPPPDGRLTDAQITRVAAYLHALHNETTPRSLHVLGLPPPPELRASYLVTALRRRFLDALATVFPPPARAGAMPGDREAWLRKRGEIVIERHVLHGAQNPPAPIAPFVEKAKTLWSRIAQADLEISRLLHALDGRYVPPGPGPDPVRNRKSVPSGRNLFALNPEQIPTHASWDVAVQLVDAMLERAPTRKVGIDLNGMNTMRDFGVNEAQILYLLGVRPVWDENDLVIDVELIPREQLGRPRVDVFVAMGGQYKENFPSRVRLLDKAIRLVARLDEPDNRVRAGTERMEKRLLEHGFSAQRAHELAVARIFGTKPGNMSGTNILHLVPRSGVWDNEREIASVYIDSMSYVFTGEHWGEKIDDLYPAAIADVDTVVRVWASNMTSQLSNHHAYEYLGGLSLAIKTLTGKEPRAWIADVRDPDRARLRRFEEVLATSLRAELLNRRWIEGMKGNEYAGAGQMAELVKNTFGWSATRRTAVDPRVWREIEQIYVEDRYRLELRAWFEKHNPHALEEIAATLLEASRKGYWQPSDAEQRRVARLYAELVVRHGPSNGLVSGGNRKLDETVQRLLDAPGDAALAAAYREKVAQSRAKPAGEKVRGRSLTKQTPHTPSATARLATGARPWLRWLGYAAAIAGVLLVLLLGAAGRAGSAD